MKRIRPLEWVVIAVVVLVCAAILWPVQGGYPASKTTICLSNVKQQMTGMLMYGIDFADRFPSRDLWMDETQPYVKSEDLRHCPSVPKAVYGYAFNGALSRVSQAKLPDPVATPAIYDSVNPIRNGSDLCMSLPLPGRHGRGEGGGRNSVAYADGHAKSVPAVPVVH